MEQIKKLSNQNLEILQLIKGILRLFKKEQITNNAFAVRLLLSILSKKLNTHLTAVDQLLYFFFADHEESEKKSMVKGFIAETGKIKAIFGDYIQKWVKTTSKYDIAFIMETNEIFRTLSKSISKENDVLVSLVENNRTQEVLSYSLGCRNVEYLR